MKSHRLAWGVVAALLTSCSGRAPAPTVAPEPPPSSIAVAPPAPTEAVVEIDAGLASRSLAGLITPSEVRARALEPYANDPRVQRRIDALLESTRSQFAIEARSAAAHDLASPDLPSCRVAWTTRELVSIECATQWQPGDRDDYASGFVRNYALEIVGLEVRPLETEGAFVDRAAMDATVADALTNLCAIEERWLPSCPDGLTFQSFELAPLQVRVSFETHDHDVYLAGVPYADILDRLRADGPVARVLHAGAFANAAPSPATGTDAGPWVIGPAIPDVEAVSRWTALAPRDRAAVVAYVTSTRAVMQLGVVASVGIDRAREIATALHGSLTPVPDGASLRLLELWRAHRSLNVRADGDSGAPYVMTLPRGAIVTAITDPAAPTAGWTTVVASRGVEGWVSARYLDHEDCFPSATSALDELEHELHFDHDQLRADLLRARAGVVVDGHTVPAVLFVSGDFGVAALQRLSDDCIVGDWVGLWRVEHSQIVDALVTRTTDTGDPLVLVAVQPPPARADRPVTWHALRPRVTAPVWERSGLAHPSSANDVQAPATRGPSGTGFWPLAIVRRGQPILTFHWNGSTLIEDGATP